MIVLGVISDHRAAWSKSPLMHNAVLAARGVAGWYAPFSVDPGRLAEAIAGLTALGIRGVNVTVPYKEQVMAFLDECSPTARAVGAVNTILNENGRLIGENTDADGFMDALGQLGFDPAGRPCLVVGCGGAAKAALYALTQKGARATVAGRDAPKARAAAEPFGAAYGSLDDLTAGAVEAHLLVNAASVSAPGEAPNLAVLLPKIQAPRCRFVMDLNYGRAENLWRDLAERLGASFQDGRVMLAAQAARGFQLFTGVEADLGEFLLPLEAAL